MVCYALLCVLSSFAFILKGKTEPVFFYFVFLVSCDCYTALPYGVMGWSAIIMVFPDHIHLLFSIVNYENIFIIIQMWYDRVAFE